jgi:hypothetical protein
VARGSRVRLRPDPRHAAEQGRFVLGRVAHVEGVYVDGNDQRYLAVPLEQDHGHCLYFGRDEVEPLA